MSHSATKQGSVIGGMLLIAGSCIGMGMLALPILTGLAGLVPSFVMFFIAWLFMTTTAILLVEVSSWFEKDVNFISMVERTLGMPGKIACWVLYLFLFYALLVAYMADSGNHLSSLLQNAFSISVPDNVASFIFVLIFGWFIYLGTRPVDLLNRGLMVAKIAAFIVLIAIGLAFVKTKNLTYTNVEFVFFSIPIAIISFGFHNMIPSLNAYLGRDVRRVKQAIIGGSLFVFVVYIIWQIVTLGILPVGGENGILSSYYQDIDAAQGLSNYLGLGAISVFAQILAFFAILTSFLAQGLSVVHFLGDGMKIKRRRRESVWLCALALVPPLILSIFKPQILFQALNFAGGICAVALFGILPVLMVWIGRYRHKISQKRHVKGGVVMLLFIFLFAAFVFLYQASQMLNLPIFPKP